MPTKTYPLEEGGPDRVEMSWGRKFRNFTVTVDGQRLNPEPYELKDLQVGQKLPLNDGTSLHVKFDKGFMDSGLKVTRDWKPLPGSPSHPATIAKGASTILFVIAGFTALWFGISMAVGATDWVSAASVLIFIALGIAVRRGSLIALWAGLILFGLDTVLFLAGGDFEVGWLIVRGFLLFGLWKGIPALKELRDEKAAA